MRRSSSLVGTPSRRAATVARRGSGDMGISLRIVEAEFTAEHAYLVLDLHDDRQVAGIRERVSGIFARSQEHQRRVETVRDPARWLAAAGFGHAGRLASPCHIAAGLPGEHVDSPCGCDWAGLLRFYRHRGAAGTA